MAHVTLPEYKLTAQDIKALRHADDICFFWSDGESFINANLNRSHSSTGFDQSRRIATQVEFHLWKDSETSKYQVTNYDNPYSCFAMSGNYDCMRTITEFLKEGDSIRLEWHSCSDGYLKGSKTTVKADDGSYIAFEERLWTDSLYLTVFRPAKTAEGYKSYKFFVRQSTIPDNSAKMVRMTRR